MAELLKENGWLGSTIIILIQFVYILWKDQSKKDRKILEAIQANLKVIERDVNISFAFLRIMSGDKYDEIIKRLIDEKVLRE
jgi:hypothetical protein